MSAVARAVFASWAIPFWATLGVLFTAVLYIRGWMALRQLRSTLLPTWRLVCLLVGLASLWLAIASPLDAFASFLLTVHMIQHMLLMLVAPPLILLGFTADSAASRLAAVGGSRCLGAVPQLAAAQTLWAGADPPGILLARRRCRLVGVAHTGGL